MSDSVKIEDYGTVFLIAVIDDDSKAAIPIGGATLKTITLRKPSGKTMIKPAYLVTDGTDGEMAYKTIAGDIDETGEWSIQGAVELPDGKWSTSIDTFTVGRNLI